MPGSLRESAGSAWGNHVKRRRAGSERPVTFSDGLRNCPLPARHDPSEATRPLPPPPPATRPGQGRPAPPGVHRHECPDSGERFLGEQRCDTCRTFTRRVGIGGPCPNCDEPVAVTDLIASSPRSRAVYFATNPRPARIVGRFRSDQQERRASDRAMVHMRAGSGDRTLAGTTMARRGASPPGRIFDLLARADGRATPQPEQVEELWGFSSNGHRRRCFLGLLEFGR